MGLPFIQRLPMAKIKPHSSGRKAWPPDEIERRVRACVASADPAFRLGLDGIIKWREAQLPVWLKGITFTHRVPNW